MKFGKDIQEIALSMNAEWQPFWMNYKALKKLIKHIVRLTEQSPSKASPTSPPSADEGSDRSSPVPPVEDVDPKTLEKRFLKLLHAELGKTNQFFRVMQQSIKQRCMLLRERTHRVSAEENLYRQVGTLEVEYSKLMRACVQIYKDVLALERYAFVNYTGFDKILKKHDKCTEYNTRAKYMKHFVQKQDFVRYPELIKVTADVESLFQELRKQGGLRAPGVAAVGAGESAGERAANAPDPADRSEAEIAMSDMHSASAEMASLASVQRTTMSPRARARSTTDEDTAASVLLSGLAAGIPPRREAEVGGDALGARGITRTAAEVGLSTRGDEHLQKAPKMARVGGT
uniref:SPX domain-containing protein n=1 Tax=Phaeomonas parva TaxID=124430 RepID=A0A7S1TYI8_9STRA|mmetsp:Transcript_21375/g.65237  ORF Transcript_21375/g.65237 Transcript_21375/m.65237 type:complete len:345 (+) Transcript_21375:292-1326(+)